jgi:hypothetical protein
MLMLTAQAQQNLGLCFNAASQTLHGPLPCLKRAWFIPRGNWNEGQVAKRCVALRQNSTARIKAVFPEPFSRAGSVYFFD